MGCSSPFFISGVATNNRLNALENLLEQTLAGLGYELVELNLSRHVGMLRVFIDKLPEYSADSSTDAAGSAAGVTLGDCELVSRHLQRVLEVERVDYQRLEVSSPGLDRKLRKPADFERFSGHEAEVRLREPVGGRRRIVGVVRQVVGDQVELEVNGVPLLLAMANLQKARLVPKYDMQGRRSR